jgi:hypothetical protein
MDGEESLIGPGLNPPGTAAGVDHDLLAGTGSGDAAGNGVDAFAAALRGGRNFGEFDAWALSGGAGVAAGRQGAGKQDHDREEKWHGVDEARPLFSGSWIWHQRQCSLRRRFCILSNAGSKL